MSNGGFVRSTSDSPVSNLLASVKGLVTRDIIIDENQAGLKAGAALGEKTSNQRYILSASAAVDGSQTISGILILPPDEEITTGAGESVRASLLVGGQVQEGKVIFGAGHTLANTRIPLQDVGIYLQKNYDEGGFTPNP